MIPKLEIYLKCLNVTGGKGRGAPEGQESQGRPRAVPFKQQAHDLHHQVLRVPRPLPPLRFVAECAGGYVCFGALFQYKNFFIFLFVAEFAGRYWHFGLTLIFFKVCRLCFY